MSNTVKQTLVVHLVLTWDEVVNLPTLYNGNKVTGVTVSGAGQTGSKLVLKGLAAADTFKAGQIFTIAGVFKTHPLTGEVTKDLQQFVIVADVTSAGATAEDYDFSRNHHCNAEQKQ